MPCPTVSLTQTEQLELEALGHIFFFFFNDVRDQSQGFAFARQGMLLSYVRLPTALKLTYTFTCSPRSSMQNTVLWPLVYP